MNKKTTFILGLAICFTILGIIFIFNFDITKPTGGILPEFIKPIIEETTPSPTPEPTIKPNETAKFIAAGDNLIHGMLYIQAANRANNQGYNFDYAYANIEGYFKDFDVKFINQETLVNDAFEPSTYPLFSSPIALGEKILNMGFNAISTSNNHSYDKGAEGIRSSLEFWNAQKDAINFGFYTGDNDKDIKYMSSNGIKIAFLAYTAYTNGLSIYDETSPKVILANNFEVIENQIAIAKENSDIVIVSCHWGNEDTNNTTSPQEATAQRLSEFGADVIIGHHPHVIQKVEWVTNQVNDNKTLVCYSLGNFISAQSASNNMLGGLFQFDIVKKYKDLDENYDIEIESPYFVPTITHYEANHANVRNYLLKDYTLELSQKHGVKAFDSNFSLEKMEWIVNNYIPEEFLLYK